MTTQINTAPGATAYKPTSSKGWLAALMAPWDVLHDIQWRAPWDEAALVSRNRKPG